jgi:choline dehydrogenase-like flavoprotein
MRCPAFNARTRRFFVDDRDHPYATPAGKPYNWFRGRQVGGRLHTWGRVVMRMSDLEFKGASRDGCGIDWPLAYADLAPCYDKVEAFLGVRGTADGIASVPDGRYSGRFEMTSAEVAFKAAVETAFPGRCVIAARVASHDRERTPATLRAAQRTGRMVMRSNAVVRSIVIDPVSGRATGVAFIDRVTKQPGEARAKAVVLCAGTVESVRILLNSACLRHPAGLGNSSGRLGLGITDHLLVGIGGPYPPTRVTNAPGEPDDPYDFGRATGFFVPRFRNVERAHAPFRRGYAIQGGIGRGPAWYLMAHGEMLSQPSNRISIDRVLRDAWGIPVARIECTWSANDLAMIEEASIVLRQMADVARLPIRTPPSGKLLETVAYHAVKGRLAAPSGAFLPGSAIHELGGAAMGDDSTTSVLDAYGRCWDAPNVFVTDGACFASGCSQNVTLTIMALTVRACDRLASEFRAGTFQT